MRPAPDHLVDPVREVRRPGRVEAADEHQLGDVVGAADLAVHDASSHCSSPGRAGTTSSAVLTHSAGTRDAEPPGVVEVDRAADLGRWRETGFATGPCRGSPGRRAARPRGRFPRNRSPTPRIAPTFHARRREREERRLRHLARAGDRRERRVAQVVGDLAEDVDPRLAEGQSRVAHLGRAVDRHAHQLEALTSLSASANRRRATHRVDLAGRKESADPAGPGKTSRIVRATAA